MVILQYLIHIHFLHGMNITKPKVLIADDDETFCYVLKEQLVENDFEVYLAPEASKILPLMQRTGFDLVLLDLHIPGVSGFQLLSQINNTYPTVPVIFLTGENDAKTAVEAIRHGAFDYVVKPYTFDELLITINRATEHKELLIKSSVLEKIAPANRPSRIIGESEQLKQLLVLAEKAANSNSNILIEGETGTGKELLAEFIHKTSPRVNKPFVVINCASLPDQLIESELFGHEKGAFTDAKNAKQGLVEIANGGTLFLDEIGELSLSLQPKLLRFLENGEFRRIGGLQNIHSDVRVISATNRDLIAEAELKNFRSDLLFRLNVITLRIPALRERTGDIVLLAEHFIRTKSPIRSPKQLSPEAKQALECYPFPGNIRELEHTIERAIIFADSDTILPQNLFLPNYQHQPVAYSAIVPVPQNEKLASPIKTIEELEKEHIEEVLKQYSWDQGKTALALDVSLKTLYNKIKKYDLKKD